MPWTHFVIDAVLVLGIGYMLAAKRFRPKSSPDRLSSKVCCAAAHHDWLWLTEYAGD
jgi:hypothetical protein